MSCLNGCSLWSRGSWLGGSLVPAWSVVASITHRRGPLVCFWFDSCFGPFSEWHIRCHLACNSHCWLRSLLCRFCLVFVLVVCFLFCCFCFVVFGVFSCLFSCWDSFWTAYWSTTGTCGVLQMDSPACKIQFNCLPRLNVCNDLAEAMKALEGKNRADALTAAHSGCHSCPIDTACCRHLRDGTSCAEPHDIVPSYTWRNCGCYQTFRESVPETPGISEVPPQRITDLAYATRQLHQLSCILDSCTITASHKSVKHRKLSCCCPAPKKGSSTRRAMPICRNSLTKMSCKSTRTHSRLIIDKAHVRGQWPLSAVKFLFRFTLPPLSHHVCFSMSS